jgi:hypothetical protein
MVNDIKEKLLTELSEEINTERQVIYILSRIRKILESDKKKKKYKVLNFYCNWALHAEIEDISSVKDLVDGILSEDSKALLEFMKFNIFHTEFKKFLSEYGLPTNISDDEALRLNFNINLSNIYTDTPMVIKEIKRTRIIWSGASDENGYGGSFSVVDENE